ncbi:MAG: RNA-binding transcriptional accessory protein, partial [Lachnospiraceae bacterium]|nr:RNA-binding transcriptional accessory protein [Lachnospiraceae bacterium]
MDIIAKIAEELQIKKEQVQSAVQLIDEGNTIPFIARYRKEVTGALNDEILRNLADRLTYLRNLEDKKITVLSSIEEQGKLTEELKAQILSAETQVAVDDLYRPYRPKRRTRAIIAKEKGLEPLATLILLQMLKTPLAEEAKNYISQEKGVETIEEAITGAKDIIAEVISDNADYRTNIRNTTMKKGKLVSSAKDKELESVYEVYYDYEEALTKIVSHRILAMNRAEKEKIITIKMEAPVEDILRFLEKKIILPKAKETESAQVIKEAIADAYERLIAPSIEREIRNALTEQAEESS